MLLTITTTHSPATDLGFLVGKNPARPQTFSVSFGEARIFYPDATAERCTMAMQLVVDPVHLVRGPKTPPERRDGDRHGQRDGVGGTIDEYVNDRPYVAGSMMSVAISRVLGSALNGHCKSHPTLAETPIDLTAHLPTLPCRHRPEFLPALFEPLGYSIDARRLPLDPQFPEWGDSAIYDVRLRHQIRLRELLAHLYVLIPVLDNAKHYYVSADEIEKLLGHGAGWLATHPQRHTIVTRYLKRSRPLINEALEQLLAAEDADAAEAAHDAALDTEPPRERMPAVPPDLAVEISPPQASDDASDGASVVPAMPLRVARLEAVMTALSDFEPRSVLDLGCGTGELMRRLLEHTTIPRIVGMDVAWRTLEIASRKLRLDRRPPAERRRIELFQGALTYRDARLSGFDVACLVEVIEHLDPSRLAALERVVFEFARPHAVIVTTPNADYNPAFQTLPADALRHPDHRFEWGRETFRQWARKLAERTDYRVAFRDVGPVVDSIGAPTQMGVFSR